MSAGFHEKANQVTKKPYSADAAVQWSGLLASLQNLRALNPSYLMIVH
jgi:hypothetical protein